MSNSIKLKTPTGYREASGTSGGAMYTKLTGDFVEDGRLKVSLKGTVFFVDGASGDDSAQGAPDTPLKTIQAAIDKPNVDCIVIKPGIYRESLTIDKPISVFGETKSTYNNTASDDLSHMVDVRASTLIDEGWTLVDSDTYTTTSTTPRQLWVEDLYDENGLCYRLTHQSNLQACKDSPGSWFRDGGDIYVHLPNGENPNNHKIEQADTLSACTLVGDCEYADFYNIAFSFSGDKGVGIRANEINITQEYRFYNCVFRYHWSVWNSRGMGMQAHGNIRTKCYNCKAYGARYDGYNYHYGGFHELYDCMGYLNNDDGASPHATSAMLVRGGHYYGNGKAGLIAVTGASMVVENCLVYSNVQGISYFDPKTVGRIKNSLVENNDIGFRVTQNATCFVDNLGNVSNDTPVDISSDGRVFELPQ